MDKRNRGNAADKLMFASALVREAITAANVASVHKSTVRKLARVELMLTRTAQDLMRTGYVAR